MKKVFLSAIIAIATMWANVAHAQGGLSPQQVQQKAIETTRVAGMETQSSMTIYSPSGDKRVRKMTIVSKLYENYNFLTEQKVDGHDCYVLEIIPKNKTIANENGFSKKISYIDKRIFVVRKATYYNLAGEKEKEMTVSAIAEVDTKNHKYRFKEMTMVNLKNKRKSVLNNNVIKFTPSISDSYFTTRTLEQGK